MELTPEMEGSNWHLQEERQAMSEHHQVYIHLLLSTQFGIHKNEASSTQCALCGKYLIKSIHHIWMRVLGGIRADTGKWEYMLVFKPGCHQCKPSHIRKFALLVLKAAQLETLNDFIHEHAFQNRSVEVENFLAGERNSHTVVFSALVANYLYRFMLINAQIPALCVSLFSKNCFYCHGEKANFCLQCKSLYFCNHCRCKADKHHTNTCLALKSGQVIHDDHVYFIERTIQGRCLRFKPSEVETFLANVDEELEK